MKWFHIGWAHVSEEKYQVLTFSAQGMTRRNTEMVSYRIVNCMQGKVPGTDFQRTQGIRIPLPPG